MNEAERDYEESANRLVIYISYLAGATMDDDGSVETQAHISDLCAHARNMIQVIEISAEEVASPSRPRLVEDDAFAGAHGPIADLCHAARIICNRMDVDEIERACKLVLRTLSTIEGDRRILNFPRPKTELRLVTLKSRAANRA
jgi:hypothetical protein